MRAPANGRPHQCTALLEVTVARWSSFERTDAGEAAVRRTRVGRSSASTSSMSQSRRSLVSAPPRLGAVPARHPGAGPASERRPRCSRRRGRRSWCWSGEVVRSAAGRGQSPTFTRWEPLRSTGVFPVGREPGTTRAQRRTPCRAREISQPVRRPRFAALLRSSGDISHCLRNVRTWTRRI